MIRKLPKDTFLNVPCLVTAVCCALNDTRCLVDYPDLRMDGYATLASANKWIRRNLSVTKRTDYKRGERSKLKDLHLDGRAIICVLGHYIYVDGETYWSFFDNEYDDVVTVWKL